MGNLWIVNTQSDTMLYTCSECVCMTSMNSPLPIPAYQVYPVRCVAGQVVESHSSVQREEVLHCAGVSPCLWTIGEITTNHPGDDKDYHDDDDCDDDDDDVDDDILTYLYP